MSEKYNKYMFSLTGLEKEGVTLEDFSSKASAGDPKFLNYMFSLTGLEEEGITLEQFSDGFQDTKKKSQAEPTPSNSSDGELLSKEVEPSPEINELSDQEVEPTPERKELTEEERLKGAETANMFGDTFTPMEDPNATMPSEDRLSLGEEDQQKLETQEAVSFPTETEEEYVVSTVDNIFKGDDKIDDYLLEKENPGPVNDAVISKYYKTLSEYYGSDRLEEKKKKKEEEGLPSDIAKDVALDEISDEAYALSMITRDLSEEEIEEYSKDVNIYADLMSKHSDEGGLSSDETKELVRANSKIREIRDGHDLVNPLTGNIDKAYTEKIGKITEGYKKEKDFSKLKTAYLSEYNKMGFIYSEFEEEIEKYAKQEEDYNERTGADKDFFTSKNPLQRMLALKNLKDKNLSLLTDEYQTSTDEEKKESELIKSKVLEYEKSFNKYLGISSALLFNVDPGTVNRGFKFLNKAQEGDFVNSIGKFTNALSETFKEEMSGRKVFSDRDFAKTYAKVANENGIKTTPDQVEALKNEFSEDLGDAGAITSSIMLDIIVKGALMRNASSLAGIPSAIAKLKFLKDSPRLAKVVGHLYEGTMQGAAFAVADDRTGFAMGATEYGVGEIFKSAVNAITKGKSGKFLNLTSKLLGRGAGGVSEEYLGEGMDKRELFELGVFDEKLWDLVLGASEDEAWKKFAITAIMSFGFGTAAEVSSFISNNEDYIKSLDGDAKTLIEELVDANKKEQQAPKKETTGDLETDLLSDQKKIKAAENKSKKRAAKDKAQEERAKKIEDKNLELKLNKEKSIGEETLVPLTEEVDIDGKTFLTTEGETDVNTLNQEEEIDIDVEEINEIRQKNNAKKESTLESNLDKPVSYKGEKGVLKQEGQQIVFESDTKIVELGNVEEVSSTPLSDITDLAPIDVETKSETTTEEEITPEETTAEKETTIKKELTHEGVDYTIQDHKVNKKGESILTVKEVDTGLTRKLKGDVAEKGRVILEEAKAANTIKAEEARESKQRVKKEEQEASDFNNLLAEEEYNKKTEEELEIEEAKSKEEVAKFEEELTDVITKEQKVKKEKGLVISEGGKKFLVRQKSDGNYSVAAIRSDGKTVAFTGKNNVDARNKLIERFKDKVSTSEDIALQEGAALSEEFKKEQEDKILNFLDKAIEATSTKGRAFDATLGIPLAISNGALKVVRASYNVSKNLAEAISAGMAHLAKMDYKVDETKFTDFVLDSLSDKKVKAKTQEDDKSAKTKKDDKTGAKKPPVRDRKIFQKGRQEGKKEIKTLQDSFGEFVKGKTKEIRELSPKLTATVLKKAALLKTEKGLASAKAYVEKVLSNKKFRLEEAARSNSLDFIGKALERNNWKKKGKKNQGKISKESQEFLQKAAVASKLTKEQANEKRINILSKKEGQELTEETIEDLQALTFAGLDEASQYDLDNATQLIKEYQKSGREQLRAKLESIKAEDRRVSKVLLNAVTNFGKKKIEKAEIKDSFSLTTLEKLSPEQWFGVRPAINYLTGMSFSINQINARNAGFSDLLDIINNTSSSSVKGGATEARTILEKEFYRPLKQARLNLLTGTRRKLDKVKNAKIEIFGKKESFNKLSTTERIADINSNIKEKAEKNLKESGVELDNETLKIEVQNLEVELQSNADFIGVDTSKPGWKGGLTEKSLARIETINEARRSLYEEELVKLNDESYSGERKISKREIIKRADEIIADKAKTYKISSEEESSLKAADKILETTHILLNKSGEELKNSKDEKLKITNDEAITIYNWSKNPEYAKVLDSMSNEVSLEGKKNKNYSPKSEAKIKKAMELVENNPKLKAYADFTIDFYKEYHPEISDSHMEFYNLGLTQVENHTPGKRVDIDVQEDLNLTSNSKNIASTRNGSLLDRQNSMKPLDLSVGSSKTMKKYIEQMEHFIHMTPIAKKLTKGLKSTEAKNAISQTTGNYMNTILGKHIDDIVVGEAGMKSDGFENFNKIRGNVTTSALALKATLYPKQLTSAIAYAAETDTGAWLLEQAKFLTEDFTADRKMIWNSDFIQNRLGKGYDIEVSNAIHQQGNYSKLRSKLTDLAMTPTKYGDIHAIMGGGVAFYRVKKKEYLKQGMSKAKAEKEAFLDFVIATSRAQQSSDIEETSHYQRGGKIAKTFTMFKTSPRQYYQKTSGSIRNVRKGRGSKRDLKRSSMFGGTLPLFFTLAAAPLLAYRLLKRDPSDEDAEELASALVLSNVSGLAITGDILKSVSDKVIRGKNFDYESITSLAVFQTALEKATELAVYSFKEDGPSKDYKDGEVIMDLAFPIIAVATGFPVEELRKNVKKITSGQLRRVVSGKASKEEMLSLLGYSDYSLGIKKKKKTGNPALDRLLKKNNKSKSNPALERLNKKTIK